jgi:glucose dehydrogenase
VDDIARILVSVAAGLFLLVPMITLSFITPQRVRLGVTVAFVLVFAIVLGLVSKATNDALMAAAAAYAAVLVVFVGQTTPIN